MSTPHILVFVKKADVKNKKKYILEWRMNKRMP